jgi:phosphinothricin acetyltransferase
MVAITEFVFSPVSETEREAVIDLFNYYIEHSYAAYPEDRVPHGFFDLFLESCRKYPSIAARLPDGNFAGVRPAPRP